MPACAFSESQIGRCCTCLCRFIQRQLDTQWSSTKSSLFDLCSEGEGEGDDLCLYHVG